MPSGDARQPEPPPPPLPHPSPFCLAISTLRGVQEKENAFAETFSRASQTKDLPAEVASWRVDSI